MLHLMSNRNEKAASMACKTSQSNEHRVAPARLLWLAWGSAMGWLIHSFAVRSLFAAIHQSASKLGH